MLALLAATNVADPEAYLAVVQGFSAFGSVIGVCSAAGALLGLAWFDGSEGGRLSDAIGRGINYGLVAGIPLAVFFALLVFIEHYGQAGA